MPKRNPHLPSPELIVFNKRSVLDEVKSIELDTSKTSRVLDYELAIRQRVVAHLEALPGSTAPFDKFNTSPYVLLMQAARRKYQSVSEIEKDIIPAKLFSSMETSAGRLIEEISLPIYGWEKVHSQMHTSNSALDGKRLDGDVLRLVTLKSGPRCLNDEMSENFADQIIENAGNWAREHRLHKIDFSYGVLYGTQKKSNKKDWHILRNLYEKIGAENFEVSPKNKWHCSFRIDGVEVSVTIRIGADWWAHLSNGTGLLETAIAMIRACVVPGSCDETCDSYEIEDMMEIVEVKGLLDGYNSALLQRSQIPWLFFFLRHFCDRIVTR